MQKPQTPTEMTLKSAFLGSLLAHLSLLAFVVLKSLVFPSETKVFVPTLRVDMVDLPDLLKSEMDQIQESTPVQTSPPSSSTQKPLKKITPKETHLPAPHKSRMENALARIKALSKISQESPVSAPPIKGNQISAGSSLSADARASQEASYNDVLYSRIKSNWTLPVWLARDNLSAQVILYIGPNGKVAGVVFKQSSGNSRFDQEVRRAIEASQPFPPPPPPLAENFQSDGVLLGFPL